MQSTSGPVQEYLQALVFVLGCSITICFGVLIAVGKTNCVGRLVGIINS